MIPQRSCAPALQALEMKDCKPLVPRTSRQQGGRAPAQQAADTSAKDTHGLVPTSSAAVNRKSKTASRSACRLLRRSATA